MAWVFLVPGKPKLFYIKIWFASRAQKKKKKSAKVHKIRLLIIQGNAPWCLSTYSVAAEKRGFLLPKRTVIIFHRQSLQTSCRPTTAKVSLRQSECMYSSQVVIISRHVCLITAAKNYLHEAWCPYTNLQASNEQIMILETDLSSLPFSSLHKNQAMIFTYLKIKT